ncbi:MAG: P-type E1-E2 ATPase, partial [Planctomycetota bacterium]
MQKKPIQLVDRVAALPLDQVADFLEVDLRQGLSGEDVLARREVVGFNEIPMKKPPTIVRLFLQQFMSPLLLVLVVATVGALIIGEVVDGIIIAIVLVMNGVIGAYQEYRAAHVLSSLRSLTKQMVTVTRDGRGEYIEARELVPGDMVTLDSGDKVAADIRIIAAESIAVSEAVLTGESFPVEKHAQADMTQEASLFASIVYAGTFLMGGNGKGIVVATGPDTLLGGIAENIDVPETKTPLQKHIGQVTKWLVIGSIGLVVATFFLGLLLGYPVTEMLTVTISLLVSVVPEGLPVVVTLVLVFGVARMGSYN